MCSRPGNPHFLLHDTLTVCCRIWKSQVELDHAEHFSLFTRIRTHEHSLVWPIERFSTLQLGHNVTTRADLYSAFEKDRIELKFSLVGNLLQNSIAKCEITHHGYSQEVLKVKVFVLNSGRKAITYGEKKLTFDQSRTHIVAICVSRKELLEKMSECFGGDILNLSFVFTFLTSTECTIDRSYIGPSNLKTEVPRNDVTPVSEASLQTNSSEAVLRKKGVSQEKGDSLDTLGEDFLSLYKNHSFSDFELRSGDVSFPVHKVVLSARSPVFRSMFSSDMKESDTNFIEVPDVDAHSLNRMLTFLYAGTVDPLQWESAAKLYYAADKYQVQSLKQQCSSLLKSDITVSNVSDILTLADRHGDHELTSFVNDFSLSNYDEIMQSVEWGSFIENDSYFAGKTMHHLYKKRLQLNNP